jgi:Ras-related protein Rab-21
VYDVSLKETFLKVEKWYEELKIFNSDTVIAIAGNKVDMNIIDVDKSLVSQYCKEKDIEHIYTSAKTGEGLDEIFYKVAKQIASNIQVGKISKKAKKGLKITIDDSPTGKNKEGGCC